MPALEGRLQVENFREYPTQPKPYKSLKITLNTRFPLPDLYPSRGTGSAKPGLKPLQTLILDFQATTNYHLHGPEDILPFDNTELLYSGSALGII